MINPNTCVKCKGRLFCSLPKCPILEKFYSTQQISRKIGKDFQGTNPNALFISWHSWPNVSIAPLTASEHLNSSIAETIDDDENWFGLPPQKIIDFRQQLVRSTNKINVHQAANPSNDLMDLQEIILARKPIDLEVELQKAPEARLEFSDFFAPMGPSAPQKSLALQENPSIDRKLDYLTNDINVKASTALTELFDYGITASKLIKVFSAGLLGVKKNRVLVPTRYSVVAVDDILAKHLLQKVKHYQELQSIQVFESNYLDNHFFVMLVPKQWSFEMLEAWIPGSVWYPSADSASIKVIQDNEQFKGRKTYASEITGAYYSARLAIAEYLSENKRQATAIILREVSPGYAIPLGCWQIRENVRHALKQKPLLFDDFSMALSYVFRNLKVPADKWLKESKLINSIKFQKPITDFMPSQA